MAHEELCILCEFEIAQLDSEKCYCCNQKEFKEWVERHEASA